MSETMAYAGIDENGDCVAAVVDGHKFTSKEVANFIKSGLTIQHVTCEWVRQNLTVPRPKVAADPAQPSLL